MESELQLLNNRGSNIVQFVIYASIIGLIGFSLSLLMRESASERTGQASSAIIPANENALLGTCNPPRQGAWIVSSPTTCRSMTIYLKGNLTVSSSLELEHVNLVFDQAPAAGYIIEAKPGSTLRIYNSTIQSTSMSSHFSMFVRDNVDFSMIGSRLIGAGVKDPELFSGATPETDNAKYLEYGRYFWVQGEYPRDLSAWIDDGIVINSSVTEFRNNSISDFTAIWIYSDNNVIRNNYFTGMKNHGLGFMAGSDNNVIVGNYFGYAARMNRQISGIKFFPGTNNEEIANNTIEWVPESITIAEMPPYTANSGFNFHDNRIRNTLQAAVVRGNHIMFSNENYSDIYAIGISLAGYYNVTIENSSFTNLAFQEELNDEINQEYFEEGTSRNLIPSIEWYMFIFYTTKAFIRPGAWGNLLVLEDNYFGQAPPYGNGVVFDGGPHNNFRVYDNTFEDIGNYIPSGFTVRRDFTERVNLSERSDIPGAAISLELIKKTEIIGNKFRNVVNGIMTSTPDSVGSYGDYDIRNNVFQGSGTFSWQEIYSSRGNETWWDTHDMRTENGIGVGIGTHGWLVNGVDWGCTDESYWHYTYLIYIADNTHRIQNNSFSGFQYPIYIDYSRLTPCENNVLGPKHAVITGNSFRDYSGFILTEAAPSTIEFRDNLLYSCDDGTQEGYCSVSKPLFCQEGVLVPNCSTCGCPSGYACNTDGYCSAPNPSSVTPKNPKPMTNVQSS